MQFIIIIIIIIIIITVHPQFILEPASWVQTFRQRNLFVYRFDDISLCLGTKINCMDFRSVSYFVIPRFRTLLAVRIQDY